MAEKVKITIDGVTREVDADTNVLQAILNEGQVIPHFCYHEALGAAGACRLCACMIAPGEDKPARLEMSCMVKVADGMVVNVNDDYASKFRKQVIEDLMLNHPHDCPVCDEGGECMLQDMTVLSEHQHRRNRFSKRTWVNQDLGPFIHHEMNRCIQCYRCVRYYRDYALGDDFGVFGSRDRVYFGRVEDGTLESNFSGNLVDVCPTGVFTDKQFRGHYTRPWDLQTSRSVCPSCSVGCNVLPGYRNNTLRRIKPAEQPAVNRFFMCDRGRYGGEFVNSDRRIKVARVNGQEVSIDEAIKTVASRLKEIAQHHGPSAIAAVGSDRATLEANAALGLLMKGLGSNRATYFASGQERAAVRRAASITASGELTVPTLTEIEDADYILILGGDITGEAPMIDLAVRQAHRKGAAVYICSPRAGELDQFAKASWRCLPGEEATIASFISSVPAGSEAEDDNFVQKAAVALQKAKKPLVLCSVVHDDSDLVEAAANLAKTATAYGSRACKMAYFFKAVNSAGIGLIRNDEDPDTIWADIEAGAVKALVISERDLTQDGSNSRFAELLSKLEFLVVIDSIESETSARAHAILPCVSHYQAFGTLVNYEGRAQAFDGMHFATEVNLAASEILTSLIQEAGVEESIGGTDFQDIFDVTRESSLHMDRLRVGDNGCVIRTSPKLPPQARKAVRDETEDKLRVWNVYHAFGSEELSSLSAGVTERAPQAYIELHPEDAEQRNLQPGQIADLSAEAALSPAPLQVNPDLARGVVAVPVLLNLRAMVDANPEVTQ